MGRFVEAEVSGSDLMSWSPTNPDSSSGRIRLLLMTDTDLLVRGGSERFLNNLLEGLDPECFAIDVIQLSKGDAALPSLQVHGAHLRTEYRPVGPVYSRKFWLLWRDLAQRVRQGGYDIIQSQHEKSDLLCALLPRGPNRPLRVSNRRDTGFQKSRSLRLLFRRINHRFDQVVAPAQAILDQLVAHENVDANRTRCLPNGVDCDKFKPVTHDVRVRERIRHGLPLDAYLFGCVARMVSIKRHEDLILGFAQAVRDRSDAKLILVGNGPLEQGVRQLIRDLGITRQVMLFGEGQAMEQLLPLLDAFVLTSSTEGMSNAILEAMACGLPTIATAVGGNPELVEPGTTGYLVPPFEPNKVAAAMTELLEQREYGRTLGRRARARAEAEFSLPAMVNAFSSLYLSARGVAVT